MLARESGLDVLALLLLSLCPSSPHGLCAPLAVSPSRAHRFSWAHAPAAIAVVATLVSATCGYGVCFGSWPEGSTARFLEFAYGVCGVCFGSWPEGSTARIGRTVERARFKRLPGRSARDLFFGQSGIEGDGEGGWKLRSARTAELAETEDFPEAPLDLLAGELWTPVISRPWEVEGSEDIYIFELCALLRGN